MVAAEAVAVVAVHRQALVVVHQRELASTAAWAMLPVVQADVLTMA
jgi:hypothetical protein